MAFIVLSVEIRQ